MSKTCYHCDKTWAELEKLDSDALKQHKAVACGCTVCTGAVSEESVLPDPDWDKLGITPPRGRGNIDWGKKGPQKV